MKTIDDFDDLVNPRTLARHCFGPKPSSFVLRAIEIDKKNESSPFFYFYFILIFHLFTEMTTKSKQELYARDAG